VLRVILSVGLDDRGVRRLKIFAARRLDFDERIVVAGASTDWRLAQVRVLVADMFVVHCEGSKLLIDEVASRRNNGLDYCCLWWNVMVD
jgi:hypothetical protein